MIRKHDRVKVKRSGLIGYVIAKKPDLGCMKYQVRDSADVVDWYFVFQLEAAPERETDE